QRVDAEADVRAWHAHRVVEQHGNSPHAAEGVVRWHIPSSREKRGICCARARSRSSPIWSRARFARAPAPRGERSRSKRVALATPYRRSASSAARSRSLAALGMTILVIAAALFGCVRGPADTAPAPLPPPASYDSASAMVARRQAEDDS